MKLLDTNVFVYARGRPDPYRDACVALLDRARDEPEGYGIDVEVLQELLEVYGRRDQRRAGIGIVRDALTVFPDPFPISRPQIEEAVDVYRGHRALSPRDALHAAVVRTYRLEGIISADRGFDRVAGLTRFDPMEFAAG